MAIGQRRLERVLGHARQVHHARVAAARVGRTRASGHDVAVGVHGIDGIHERDDGVGRENLLKVGAIALAAVADEDLVRRQCDAARAEVLRGDLPAQPLVADVRTVALERLCAGHVVGRLVNRAHHRRGQRPRHIADPEVDDARGRVRVGERLRPPPDLGEQICGAQVQEVFVDPGHGAPAV